LVLELVLG